MENNKLIGVALSVTVGVILLATLLVPVCGIYDDSMEYHNEVVDYAKYIPADGEYTIHQEVGTMNWTLNGSPWAGGRTATMLYSTEGSIIVVHNYNNNQITPSGFVPQPTYKIHDGVFESINASNEVVYSVAWPGGWVRTMEKTDHVFGSYDHDKYVPLDEAENWSISSWADRTLFFRITGNLASNDLDVEEITGRTISNVSTEVVGHVSDGVFIWSKLDIHYTWSGTDYTSTVLSVVIPETVVSADKENTWSELFAVIPVFVVVAFLGMVAFTVVRRND